MNKISPQKRWQIKNPWFKHYNNAEQRCNNENRKKFKKYGEKNIKFRMTLEDFKYLWFRDKAFNMKLPSIDRIDPKHDYHIKNCRFIEHSLNSKRGSIHIRVVAFDVLGRKFEFESLRACDKFLGKKYISKLLNRKSKDVSYKGYLWNRV